MKNSNTKRVAAACVIPSTSSKEKSLRKSASMPKPARFLRTPKKVAIRTEFHAGNAILEERTNLPLKHGGDFAALRQMLHVRSCAVDIDEPPRKKNWLADITFRSTKRRIYRSVTISRRVRRS